jgi:hypothetical protein
LKIKIEDPVAGKMPLFKVRNLFLRLKKFSLKSKKVAAGFLLSPAFANRFWMNSSGSCVLHKILNFQRYVKPDCWLRADQT